MEAMAIRWRAEAVLAAVGVRAITPNLGALEGAGVPLVLLQKVALVYSALAVEALVGAPAGHTTVVLVAHGEGM